MDSIGLVPLLEERYLWIDALCIVQDDDNVKLEELKRMAAIYASSILTIIAGDGLDAHHGLRGIRGFSGNREIEQKVQRFGSRDYLVAAMFSRAHEVCLQVLTAIEHGRTKNLCAQSGGSYFKKNLFDGCVLSPFGTKTYFL
jgi:hypothetical protein